MEDMEPPDAAPEEGLEAEAFSREKWVVSSSPWGYTSWLDGLRDKSQSKMDDDWGYPFFRKPTNAECHGNINRHTA